MKKNVLIILTTLLALNPTAWAAKRDLKILNTLIKVGVQSDAGMSHIYLGVQEVDCSYSSLTGEYECGMNDVAANDGEGGPLILKGKKAKRMFHLLAREVASRDNGMGRISLSVPSISCSQVAEGVDEGDLAERTECTVETY